MNTSVHSVIECLLLLFLVYGDTTCPGIQQCTLWYKPASYCQLKQFLHSTVISVSGDSSSPWTHQCTLWYNASYCQMKQLIHCTVILWYMTILLPSLQYTSTHFVIQCLLWSGETIHTLYCDLWYRTIPTPPPLLLYTSMHSVIQYLLRSGETINRGFPTKMVHIYYIACLRYTILVGNPQNTLHWYL